MGEQVKIEAIGRDSLQMSGIVDIGANRNVEVGVLAGNKIRNLDRQKRLTVSANWRHAMGSDENGQTHVYVAPGRTSKGQDCLDVIPASVINNRYAFIADISEDDPLRKHVDVVFEGMEHKTIDIQGRVGIPRDLLEYAGIVDNVKMIGAGDCIKVIAVSGDAEKKKIDFDAYRESRMALAELKNKS